MGKYVMVVNEMLVNKPDIYALSDYEWEGVVDEMIQPNRGGRVYFRATWWPARCLLPVVLVPGDKVRVIGYHNITLIVEPLRARARASQSQPEPEIKISVSKLKSS